MFVLDHTPAVHCFLIHILSPETHSEQAPVYLHNAMNSKINLDTALNMPDNVGHADSFRHVQSYNPICGGLQLQMLLHYRRAASKSQHQKSQADQ